MSQVFVLFYYFVSFWPQCGRSRRIMSHNIKSYRTAYYVVERPRDYVCSVMYNNIVLSDNVTHAVSTIIIVIIIMRVRKREMDKVFFFSKLRETDKVPFRERISYSVISYTGQYYTILLLILFSGVLLTFGETDTIDEHDIIMYYTARSDVVINKFHYVYRVHPVLYNNNAAHYDNLQSA